MRYPTQYPPEPSGNSKETTWFRQLLKNIRERSIKVGPGLRASYKVDGTLIELTAQEEGSAPPAPSSEIKLMRIAVVAEDYFRCYEETSSGLVPPSATLIPVLKPFHLRRTLWDTKTIDGLAYSYISNSTRAVVVSGQPGTEYQKVVPPISASGIIPATIVIIPGFPGVPNPGQQFNGTTYTQIVAVRTGGSLGSYLGTTVEWACLSDGFLWAEYSYVP